AEYERFVEQEQDAYWFSRASEGLTTWRDRERKLHYNSVLGANQTAAGTSCSLDPGKVSEGDRRKATGLPIAATGASLAGGSPLTGVVSLFTTTAMEEVRTSVRFNAATLLSRASPSNLFGAAALSAALMPQSPSRDLLMPQLVARIRTDTAQ